MKRWLILPAFLFPAACAVSRPDIIQVGPWSPPRSRSELLVLDSRERIDRPWGAVAVIHGTKFPARNEAALKRQKEWAAKLAAGVGADGVVITEEIVEADPRLEAVGEPESYISALAFKYASPLSTAPALSAGEGGE